MSRCRSISTPASQISARSRNSTIVPAAAGIHASSASEPDRWIPAAAGMTNNFQLPVDAAEAEVFDFEELLDAVFGALAADAAFFHAPERRDLGRDDALVDADDAVFQRLGDSPDAANVAAVEIGGEAQLRIGPHPAR